MRTRGDLRGIHGVGIDFSALREEADAVNLMLRCRHLKKHNPRIYEEVRQCLRQWQFHLRARGEVLALEAWQSEGGK